MNLAGALPALALLAAPAEHPPAPPPPPATIAATQPTQAEPAARTAASEPARARPRHAPGDPLERFNRGMFRLFRAIDKAIFRPLALGYRHVVPRPLRSGLRNFFSNLGEPIVFLNDMLQLRPRRAVRTLGRFTINTTVGLAGLVDVATREKLPHHNNGFGDTMAFYGVKAGPYVFVPFLGPSTLRDLLGGVGDGMVLPRAVGTPFDRTDYQIARTAITGLDQRAEADDDLQTLYRTALDPYATLRSVYLQSREGEIRGLKAHDRADGTGIESLDDPLTDPGAGSDATPPPADATPAPEDAAPVSPDEPALPADDTAAPPARTPSLP